MDFQTRPGENPDSIFSNTSKGPLVEQTTPLAFYSGIQQGQKNSGVLLRIFLCSTKKPLRVSQFTINNQ